MVSGSNRLPGIEKGFMKYRKKPVVIDAWQFNKGGDHPKAISTSLCSTGYGIETLEGFMEVTPGDFIIRGVKGEYYPCKRDIFKATYDPA